MPTVSAVPITFRSPHINVIYRKSESSKKQLSNSAIWLKACKRLSSRLRVGKGPFGSGLFKSYSCFTDSTKNYGPEHDSDWSLTLTTGKDETLLDLKDGASSVSQVKFPASDIFISHLLDKGFADLIVFSLLEKSPALIGLKEMASIKVRGLEITRATKHVSARFSPPKYLVLYQMTKDKRSGLLVPTVLGSAKRTIYKSRSHSKNGIKKQMPAKGTSSVTSELSNTYYKWVVMPDPGYHQKGMVWAHASEGRGRFLTEEKVKNVLIDAFNQLEIAAGRRPSSLMDAMGNFLLDTAASGYVGLRIGGQVLAGDNLLGKSTFLGVLAEIRGGPLEGVRVYYDVVPKVVSEVDTGPISLEWARVTTGMSFGFRPEFFFVDRIDIVPKVGTWNFSALLPIITSIKTVRQAFDVVDSFSYGAELGVEFVGNWYSARFWAGADQAVGAGTSNASVSAQRLGVDGYFMAGPKFGVSSTSLQTNFLAFAAVESIKLESTGKAPADETQLRIKSISYESGYLGAGIAISW